MQLPLQNTCRCHAHRVLRAELDTGGAISDLQLQHELEPGDCYESGGLPAEWGYGLRRPNLVLQADDGRDKRCNHGSDGHDDLRLRLRVPAVAARLTGPNAGTTGS